MKKIVNGKVVKMTPQEIAQQAAMTQTLPPETPTLEQRLSALEALLGQNPM